VAPGEPFRGPEGGLRASIEKPRIRIFV